MHPEFDLVDETNKIVISVSATASKAKIESSLSKIPQKYHEYHFKFLGIAKVSPDLRAQKFSNPHNLKFEPQQDIFDVSSILGTVLALEIDQQIDISEFLNKELPYGLEPVKIESDLTTIIKILTQEDLTQEPSASEITPFEIDDKISYNRLEKAKPIIEDYKIHYPRVEKIYAEFDRNGVNKSYSILQSVRLIYTRQNTANSDDRFLSIIETLIKRVQASANHTPMSLENLELCVSILVVDAFIRCKIFDNPLGKNHVST